MTKYFLTAIILLLLHYFSFCQVRPKEQVPVNRQLPQVSQSRATQQTLFYGRVFDRETKSSIAGVRVLIINVDSNIVSVTTETNTDGTYRFSTNRIQNFRIEASKSNYNKYVSGSYNTRSLIANKQTTLPDIMLTRISESGTSDGPRTSKPEQQTPVRDTTPLPKEEFLNKKLFTEYNVMPSSSSYALYYALNPGLKDLDRVPPGYQIIKPQTPPFSSSLKKKLSEKFSDDSERDNVLQQALKDSITAYHNYFNAFQSAGNINYKGVSSDTARKLLTIINNDLNAYENDIKNTRKAKNIQLTTVVATSSELLRNIMAKATIERNDLDKLIGLSSYLSSLVESASFINYFRKLLGTSSFIDQPAMDERLASPQFAAYYTGTESSNENHYLLKNDSRPFNVSVHLQMPGVQKPVSKGNDVDGRFIVSFYPAALKAIKALYIDCDPLATFGGVTLMEGIYEQMVIDSRTGKEMIIIGSGNNTINTRQAFQKPAKDLFGKAIFTEIQILVKE